MTARHPDVMQHTPILDAYLEHLHTAVAERTWRQYRNVLLRAHRQLPQGVITATGTELRRWLAAQGRLTDTRRAYRQALTGLHRWLREQEITSHDPTVDLPGFPKPHRLPRPVPADQVAQLLAGAREPVRLWCQIMLYTGARCVELARLRREDMSAASVRLLGKGDRERLVPTHAALWALVEPLPPGPVVRGPAAGNPSYLSELVAAECDRIGLGDVTAHRLRHTLATELLATTGDLRLVQEVLGHASPATTQVYTAVLVDRLSAAVRALPTWGSAAPEGGAGPGST